MRGASAASRTVWSSSAARSGTTSSTSAPPTLQAPLKRGPSLRGRARAKGVGGWREEWLSDRDRLPENCAAPTSGSCLCLIGPMCWRISQGRALAWARKLGLLRKVRPVQQFGIKPDGIAFVAHANNTSGRGCYSNADVSRAANAAGSDAKHTGHGITGNAVMTFVPSTTKRMCEAAGFPSAAPAWPPTKPTDRPMSIV